jgi:peroxiredoxin Q/BCP
MATAIHVGDRAPDFELLAANGQTVRLSDFRGNKNVVLYFYPASETPGCTVQACGFRDAYSQFQALGAEVIGISGDPLDKQTGFQSHHRLPFLVLSDPDNKVRQTYGASTLFGLFPGRVTYVIDKDGIVRYIFDSMFNVKEHIDSALKILRTLEATPA